MAKSNGFFSMRRGSTKSLTFSVLNGKQITKDRVAQVANPKTQKQQFQRAIMATVMAAYSEMKEIEDHAFQGKKKGSENQREFMSRNLVAMRNAFLRYQEENPLVSQQEFFAVAPKNPTVLPGAWIISRGSLAPSRITYNDDGHMIEMPEILLHAGETAQQKRLSISDNMAELGLRPGMQITFCCINPVSMNRIYQVYKNDYAGYVDWEFNFCRLVIKSDVDLTKEVVVTGEGQEPNWTGLGLKAFLDEVADNDKTTFLYYEAPEYATSYAGKTKLDAEIALPAAQFDESLTGAIGVITSMVDEDLRSNSTMIVRNVDGHGRIVGLTWDYVPDAWRNAAQSLGESELYLEGGNV